LADETLDAGRIVVGPLEQDVLELIQEEVSSLKPTVDIRPDVGAPDRADPTFLVFAAAIGLGNLARVAVRVLRMTKTGVIIDESTNEIRVTPAPALPRGTVLIRNAAGEFELRDAENMGFEAISDQVMKAIEIK
jgi:hypothetical protein